MDDSTLTASLFTSAEGTVYGNWEASAVDARTEYVVQFAVTAPIEVQAMVTVLGYGPFGPTAYASLANVDTGMTLFSYLEGRAPVALPADGKLSLAPGTYSLAGSSFACGPIDCAKRSSSDVRISVTPEPRAALVFATGFVVISTSMRQRKSGWR